MTARPRDATRTYLWDIKPTSAPKRKNGLHVSVAKTGRCSAMQVLHTATLVLLTLAACGGSQPRTAGTLAAMSLDAVPLHESGSQRSSTSQGDSIRVATSDGLPSKSAEALVIQGFITARVDEVRTTSAEISERVREAGGRVVRERGTGAKSDWNSLIRVRLPPELSLIHI